MNENINLCEILKGHEGETFYSPLYGSLELIKVNSENYAYPIYFKAKVIGAVNFDKQGKPNGLATECLVFPSKDQRDWNKWDKENNHKVPKTWSELVNKNRNVINHIGYIQDNRVCTTAIGRTHIEKSALALLKIYQLIEVGYGGNKIDDDDIYYDNWTIDPHGFCPVRNDFGVKHILFHTEEQVKEFLSYPENIQLLKDYFMINA